jgi:peptidoglycan/LPS O-acetylase OafA/YrhL
LQQKTAARADGQEGHLPSLDGLRLVAAMLVAGGHYIGMFPAGTLPEVLHSFTGLGMTLFFVLSGFVIHYNYHATLQQPGGVRQFLAARFARLYPLYIILFLFEFAYLLASARSPCARVGDFGGQFYALVNYLTLTQSWVFAVHCDKALVYQYGPISAVTWSISVEMFFYLAYAAGTKILSGRHVTRAGVMAAAALVYAATVIFYWLCGHFYAEIDKFALETFGRAASTATDYNDSLLRWLLYFNPLARLAEFCIGIAVAVAFMQRAPRAAGEADGLVSWTTLAAILALVAAHLWLYSGQAGDVMIGRIASQLYAPLVGIMMYCIVRDDTPWSRILSLPLAVALGQASYSIYLLHEIIPTVYARLGIGTANPVTAWALWAAALAMLAIVSRLTYLAVESPARRVLRRLLAPRLPRRT